MVGRRQDDALQALQDGLDALVTLQAAKVTFVGVARQLGVDGVLDLGPDVVRFLRASQCQDEAHVHFLQTLGAEIFVPGFAMPPGTLADRSAFLAMLANLEAIAVAGDMALTRVVATYGDANLVEIGFQMGAVDAQHLALARHLRGDAPANDRAFAGWRYLELLEVEDALFETGFVGDQPDLVAYPGPVPRNCAGVTGMVPMTSDEARQHLPPTPTPAPPPVTPEATPAATS